MFMCDYIKITRKRMTFLIISFSHFLVLYQKRIIKQSEKKKIQKLEIKIKFESTEKTR
jgi:hypothetical protein